MSSPPPADLVPLRVDVTSDDGSGVRIIDTILLDRNCWPIPLYYYWTTTTSTTESSFSSSSPSSSTRAQPPSLHELVERNVRDMAHTILSDAEVIGMGRTVRHFTNRVELWTPRLQELVEDQLRTQMWQIVDEQQTQQYPGKILSNTDNSRTATSSDTIPIRIRLTVNNIVIQDDFEWDPSVPVCPIDFAQEMSHDLNLPSEAAVAIAISIVEQLRGGSGTGLVTSSSDASKTTTSAHLIEQRDIVANTAHIVSVHRPPELDREVQ